MTRQNLITQEGFDRFLSCLDADRDRAGAEYERLRGRLVLYFQCRDITQAEECADEAINRVILKLDAGETVREPAQYIFGIARMILLESARRQMRHEAIEGDLPGVAAPAAEDDALQTRMECLRHCLERQTPDNRELIMRYYEEEKRDKINLRRELATRFGIDMNALRVRASRLRDALQDCVRKCAGQREKKT
ncbi:MAG: RNA polymerase sigma factor [Blastocatellia bacterium]